MKESTVKGTAYLTAYSFIFILTGYFINVWLGRTLGPTQYGIYGIIISLTSFINILQTTGTQAVSKFVAEESTDKDSILKTGFVIQTVSTLFFFSIFFFFAEFIANIFRDPSMTIYLKIVAFIFPLYGTFALFIDLYNGLHFFKKQAIMGIIYTLTKTVFVVSFAFFFHLKGVFYGFIIAPIIALVYGAYIPKKSSHFFPYKTLLQFSFPLIFFAIFSNLLQSVDLYFVKALLLQPELSGYYTASQNIARIPFFCISAVFLVLFPSISHSVSNNLIEKTKSTIQQSLRFILLLLMPGVLLISGMSSSLITIIYSHTYLPAAPTLSVLSIGIGFFTIFTVFTYILSAAGKPFVSLKIAVIALLETIVLCYFFTISFGIIGAAFAVTIGCFFAMSTAAFIVYRQFHVLVPLKTFLKISGASVIIFSLSKFISIPPLFTPLLFIILLSVYVLLLIFMKEFTENDIAMTQSFIPKWIQKK